MTDTILKEWRSYDRAVVPANAPTVQREECRRAFYAGARAMLTLVYEAVNADEATAERNLAALDHEVNTILKDLRIK